MFKAYFDLVYYAEIKVSKWDYCGYVLKITLQVNDKPVWQLFFFHFYNKFNVNLNDYVQLFLKKQQTFWKRYDTRYRYLFYSWNGV